MSDLYPHLLNATCSDDTEQVYIINFGFSFNYLSDKEKEMSFHSQWYLSEKYCKKWQKNLLMLSRRIRDRHWEVCQVCFQKCLEIEINRNIVVSYGF